MPSKDYILDDGLAVTVHKRRGNRNLRLTIGAGGKVRVSIPAWVPYKTGVEFARSRRQWIVAQQRPLELLQPGQSVGKSHHLEFVAAANAAKPAGRVSGTTILITYPAGAATDSPAVQAAAEAACIRALRRQAELLLPQRLAYLAAQHGFTYRTVSIKRLKSRWGSCDQHGNIILNLFLMQLPWELIDYVLLHELTHTQVLRHGPDFWQAMAEVSPQFKQLRKQLCDHHPVMRGVTELANPVA